MRPGQIHPNNKVSLRHQISCNIVQITDSGPAELNFSRPGEPPLEIWFRRVGLSGLSESSVSVLKIYIQRIASLEFVGRNESWVASISDARDFRSSILALDFCLARHLSTIQLRTRFDAGTRDIVWRVVDVSQSL